MREIITLKDKNILFSSSKAMHDEIMTHIEVIEDTIRIEYGKVADNDYWKPYKKVIVTYFIDVNEGFSLDLIKVGHIKNITKCYADDPKIIENLNSWNMVMFMFSLDLWGDMKLHFNAWKKHKWRNVELQFTPIKIQYDYEE